MQPLIRSTGTVSNAGSLCAAHLPLQRPIFILANCAVVHLTLLTVLVHISVAAVSWHVAGTKSLVTVQDFTRLNLLAQ